MNAPYAGQVSNRLISFMSDHLQYEDIGTAESGPELDSTYAGPQWAMDLMDLATDPDTYMACVLYDNYYGDKYEEDKNNQ